MQCRRQGVACCTALSISSLISDMGDSERFKQEVKS